MKKSALAEIDDAYSLNKIGSFTLVTAFLLLILPFLIFDTIRIGYMTPIDYNEGWNVIHTTRLLHSRPLYLPLTSFPFTPVNYPPLSFVIIGVLSYLTGLPVLLTGRVVSLISLLLVGYLILGIVANFTSKKSAGLLGSLLWIALVVRVADNYVGMNDPQMLAHVFSLGALYLYSKWREGLNVQKTFVMALLCCIALFIKHLLIVIPINLAITLLFNNRRCFWAFAVAGIIISSLMLLGSWLYAGNLLFQNFIELDRGRSNFQMMKQLASLLYSHLVFLLFLPFVVLVFRYRKNWMSCLIYFSLSFLLGAYVVRGTGADRNYWFDFFIAAAIVFGFVAAESGKFKVLRARLLVYGILASCLLPFSINLKTSLHRVLNYNSLKQLEEAYRHDVELLRSNPGPALFEEPLLGFDAGKEFLFDPFAGSQMIISGRITEKNLTDPINEKYFSVIVLDSVSEKALSKLSNASIDPLKPKTTLRQRWTDNTLKAVSENYGLLDRQGSHLYFFYLPRKS